MCSLSYLLIKKDNVMCAVTGRPTSVEDHVISVLGVMLASMKNVGANLCMAQRKQQRAENDVLKKNRNISTHVHYCICHL